MRIAFAGTPEVAVPVLHSLVQAGHEVAFVITRPDAPAGRGRALTASLVADTAAELGLTCHKTTDLPSLSEQLATVDAVIVVAFGAMIPDSLLDTPKHGWINLHFSLLPQWRGAAPVQYAIKSGDDVTGVTAFRIDSGMDTGPVLSSLATTIRPRETAGELLSRLAVEGAGLINATLSGIDNGQILPTPQPTEGVSLAPKITTADARVDWKLPALAIERQIRAVTPAPGAWTELNGERVKIGSVILDTDLAGYTDLGAGEFQLIENQVLVGTGSHALILDTVQPAGRNAVAAKVWVGNLLQQRSQQDDPRRSQQTAAQFGTQTDEQSDTQTELRFT